VRTPVALSIAGSDPSGGAGLQADLKTFHEFGVYGEAVVTLITVQNTRGTTRVDTLRPELVLEQLRAVIQDIPPGAAKTGALGNSAVMQAVAAEAQNFSFPLVVDPVMIGKSGAKLAEGGPISFASLIRWAYLLTPNLHEASVLAGFAVEDLASMRRAAEKLTEVGAANVLVKGGHLRGPAVDVLYMPGRGFREFPAARVDTIHTHGTGCTYSAAITAELAKHTELEVAVERAKQFITHAIQTNPGLGGGSGPLNFHGPRHLR
jgi:hydroxymethylpyrimidine/phosphomethylpyrimidine kinase